MLYEYQLNCITEGFGIFESKFGRFRVTPGTIMVISPGVWHRYRPLKGTGWKEHYIGFNGSLAAKLLKPDFFKVEHPVIKVNFQEELLEIFYQILEQVLNEKSGYQFVSYGLAIAYIGKIISVKEIAYDLGFLSLFYFSRLFKQKTGFNPTDYRRVKKDAVPQD